VQVGVDARSFWWGGGVDSGLTKPIRSRYGVNVPSRWADKAALIFNLRVKLNISKMLPHYILPTIKNLALRVSRCLRTPRDLLLLKTTWAKDIEK
jgi:hypothetical protein